MNKYIISVDQSTQGTKALLIDKIGRILYKTYKSHSQIVNDKGWVSHNPNEIYRNVLETIKELLEVSKINTQELEALAISNQRETSVVWNKITGEPIDNAVVWQCSRASEVSNKIEEKGHAKMILERTGMNLSPYFPASKICWLLENIENAKEKSIGGELCYGTIDTWLVYKLTGGKSYKTDYSNASRTQLFNIFELKWDDEICNIFGIDSLHLAEVCDSNSNFGTTNFEGLIAKEVPIMAVMGDSHGALFAQGCFERGMVKTTYGTGSSIMMNLGNEPFTNSKGLVTSLAWGLDGTINYVLEGNLNYTGAVISWLMDDMKMISNPSDTEQLAEDANSDDVYLVPAFTGLGAPYWNSSARACIVGMSRATGRNEVVRASLESIVYQITDIICSMDDFVALKDLDMRVDGGPTKNNYLMKFQSDILQLDVKVSEVEELSALGVAYAAGIKLGLWNKEIVENNKYQIFKPSMDSDLREKKYNGWKQSINMLIK